MFFHLNALPVPLLRQVLKNGTFGVSQAFAAGSVPSRGAKDFEKQHLWDFTSISGGNVPSRGGKGF